jgi:hypothetical protein
MRQMHGSKLAAVAACLSLLLPRIAAAEGLTIISQIVVPTPYVVGPVNGPSTLWISDTMVRHADGNHDQIYEVATGRMIEIDHRKREYWETTPEQRERELQAFNAASVARTEAMTKYLSGLEAEAHERAAQLEAKTREEREHRARLKEDLERELPKLPPEQQKALRGQLLALTAELQKKKEEAAKAGAEMEKQFLAELPPALRDNLNKPIPPRPVEVVTEVRTGTGSRQIAGFACEQRFITSIGTFADGSRHTVQEVEQWIAPDLEPPVPVKVLKDVRFPLMVGDVPRGLPLANIYRHKGGGDFDHSVEAVEIKKGAIDSTVFAVPAGYTKVQSDIARTLEKWRRTYP